MTYISTLQTEDTDIISDRNARLVIKSVVNARNNSKWFTEKKAHRDIVISNTVQSLILLVVYVMLYFFMPKTVDFDMVFKYVATPIVALMIPIFMLCSLKTLKAAGINGERLCAIPFGIGLMIEPQVWSDFLRYTEYKNTYEEKEAAFKREYSSYVSAGELPYDELASYQGEDRDVYAQLLKQQFDSKLRNEMAFRSNEFNEWFVSMNRGIKVDWSNLTK
ncbi:hypothetical protein LMH73_008750 [Vibrio splendidus]|nr:hypothetical protein [Vibrio splendidus]MCC4879444.1 hypothetical protein [Vibrio splendidus]